MGKIHFVVVGASMLVTAACGGQSESSATGGAAGGGAGGAGGVGGSSGTGGTSVGGSSGAGGSGGMAPGAECTDDSQCTLFSDCCTCAALGPNEPQPPSCDMACKQNSCEAHGVTGGKARCVAGQCIVGYACQPTQVFCNALPPTCPKGEVPSVLGGCWGPCVPAVQCAGVSSCTQCTGALTTCVAYDLQGGDVGGGAHCVAIPKGCEGTPTCSCMGASACHSPYSACTDLSGVPGMSCSCPNC
ncbi:MAG: hypothetical protein DYH12_27970 [Sorangiineae bacterium PRO1]|nr:hypothetical protein [Sorangiineae bacterium PRO1]